jgi:hypothetical protein
MFQRLIQRRADLARTGTILMEQVKSHALGRLLPYAGQTAQSLE